MTATASAPSRFGTHGRVLHVDLSTETHWVEEVDEAIYRQFLAGYGLGAWLMWKHFPAGADPLAPEACFAICAGLLTGTGIVPQPIGQTSDTGAPAAPSGHEISSSPSHAAAHG